MARNFARIDVTIWMDQDFRDLPPEAQHLYFILWTHPKLSYCGVVDWRPAKLSALAGGWTRDAVNRAADILTARLFIVVDTDTEECLIRSWAKHDGLIKEPRMAVSFVNSYAEVASRTLQGVIVHEAKKLREAQPTLGGWVKPQMVALLTKADIDPATLALPEPAASPSFPPVSGAFGVGLGIGRDEVSGSVSGTPTPSPTPTPNSTSPTPSEFDAFWAIYPRRDDKGHARTAWAKAVRSADVTDILNGARRYATDPNLPEAKFIPLPATWLNGERWADGPLPNRTAPATDRQAVILRAEMARAQAADAQRLEIGA